MARKHSLAGLLVALLALAVAAPMATSHDDGTTVRQWMPDGTHRLVQGRLVDQPRAQAPDAQQPEPAAEPSSAAPPPIDADTLARERQRPTRTVAFYGHVFGSGMVAAPRPDGEFGPAGPQAANTIFPTGDANLGLGAFDWCTDVASFPQSNPCDKNPNSKLALFLTAGPVQVHTPDEFVYSKLHNERGRTKDVVLDTTQDVQGSLWMSLDLFAWSVGNAGDDTFCIEGLPPDVGCPYPYWGWDPAVWPGWVVEAKLFMVELGEYGQGASEPPPIFEAWDSDSMTLVAEGATTPMDVINGIPGYPNVYEFVVNLGKPQVEVIPKTHDLVLVFNWYSVTPAGEVSAQSWRLWAGELFPAGFTLPVKNALDVEFVIPQFIHDKLLIHSVIGSAFGSYDVDTESASVAVFDDGNRPVEMASVRRVGDYQVAHGAHFKPVNITWIWDYKADDLRPGAYKVQVEACNYQHSACELTEARFVLGRDLQPVEVVVGRQGQRTASEGQLQDITSGLQTQGLAPAPTQAGAPQAQAGGPAAPRTVPGPELAMLASAAALLALALRRREA